MTYLLVAAAFTISPQSRFEFSTPSFAVASLADSMEPGTLLVSRGDCLAVRVFTRSPYTHVAVIAVSDGRTYVYESANGHGVRRRSLSQYLRSERGDTIYVLTPAVSFSRKRARVLNLYLKKQLGRPYAIKHHFTGERAEGIHCSEYVTDALQACNVIRAKQPSRVSPGSLAEGVLASNLYRAKFAFKVRLAPVVKPEARNRCEKLWIDTKFGTIHFWLKMRHWFVCR